MIEILTKVAKTNGKILPFNVKNVLSGNKKKINKALETVI